MNKLLVILFAAIIAFACAVENCFDKEKLESHWKAARDECKEAIPVGTPEYIKKVAACIMKKHNLLSEDNVLHYDKVREEYEKTKSRNIDNELKQMDECWEQSNHIAGDFFDCWTPKLHELCPDSKVWIQEE